jgi:hypothetical protein
MPHTAVVGCRRALGLPKIPKPNRDRKGVTMDLRPTNVDGDVKNQKHRSLTLAARNAVPRYRAATVRESVPLFFNHRPTHAS